MSEPNLYDIQFSYRKDDHNYRWNGHVHVMTTSIRRACELVEGAYQDAKVHVARKSSRDNILIDKEVADLVFLP